MLEQVLKILKENQGRYVSGEILAQKLGITRAAIWKQLVRLKEIGYEIEAAPRKGYCLKSVTPVSGLHPLEIKDGLHTLRFGQVIYEQREVDSTNRWAKTLARENKAPEGTLVIAESQTGGRGRIGRNWVSAPGLGLWFSLILRPQMSMSALAGIMLLTAVSMAKAIHQVTGVQVQIKWPNDLMFQSRKLVGILAELNGEIDRVNYLIVGIGVNVNHSESDFPVELRNIANSLRVITGKECSRRFLLQTFLQEFETAYDRLLQSGMADSLEYAKTYSATLGKKIKVNLGTGRILEGEALDLEADGSLLIREPSGESLRIYSGDVIEKSDQETLEE
ncbi:MAG TPA: biotin--[acetyl-CoA-carboxylase] ligase [Firmicutes bacterium]|jgi:BirA family transcriptional regulator, biotin operon repressor / biotin---[acetyl-CoA-carboxylase] ligase|nr:biotin--[acetyl-CoA-carboxylase] ligase [Bacillota bacterium]